MTLLRVRRLGQSFEKKAGVGKTEIRRTDRRLSKHFVLIFCILAKSHRTLQWCFRPSKAHKRWQARRARRARRACHGLLLLFLTAVGLSLAAENGACSPGSCSFLIIPSVPSPASRKRYNNGQEMKPRSPTQRNTTSIFCLSPSEGCILFPLARK